MEQFMLKVHELQAQGFTQKQIAEQLGRTDRTIRTWLNQMPRERKKPVRKSKLDKYKPLIETLVRENPEINGAKIYEKLIKLGFDGKSSIVREYITKIRKDAVDEAMQKRKPCINVDENDSILILDYDFKICGDFYKDFKHKIMKKFRKIHNKGN